MSFLKDRWESLKRTARGNRAGIIVAVACFLLALILQALGLLPRRL